MWQNSTELSQAGDINNLPDYYWYKENDLTQIVVIITSSITAITHHNITSLNYKHYLILVCLHFKIENNFLLEQPI